MIQPELRDPRLRHEHAVGDVRQELTLACADEVRELEQLARREVGRVQLVCSELLFFCLDVRVDSS